MLTHMEGTIDEAIRIMERDAETISILQAQVSQLQEQKDFLIGELKVASRAFEHSGLQGYQWVADQAVLMVEGDKHAESN